MFDWARNKRTAFLDLSSKYGISTKEELLERLYSFQKDWQNRPIRDNIGGVKIVGAFSLHLFLGMIKPDYIVESGVHKGLTTWIIETTVPCAKVISIDLKLHNREYVSDKVDYANTDFLQQSFSLAAFQAPAVFFDDHQDVFSRIIKAYEDGFKYIIFDDNYPHKSKSHTSLSNYLKAWSYKNLMIRKSIEYYVIFPPLFTIEAPITSENIPVGVDGLFDTCPLGLDEYKQEILSYRWMTLVRLNKCVA